MSRIGRMPVTVPAGVEVKVEDGFVTVKGPKGELTQHINKDMQIGIEDGVLTVTRPSDDKIHRSMHGLTRKLIANMVEGVTNGFTKNLEIVGVGYRASKEGDKLILNVGYSHPVEMIDPEGIIRSIVYYPLTPGRNFDEIKRMIQAIQKADEVHCSTPANWRPGDDVIISAPITCEEAAAGMASEAEDEYALDWFLRFKKDK